MLQRFETGTKAFIELTRNVLTEHWFNSYPSLKYMKVFSFFIVSQHWDDVVS